MTYAKGHHPGATWRKCDFQCHTPRDPDWKGSANLPGGSPELEKARQDWATSFVSAVADRGLSVVALTDHHDACFIPYVKKAADTSGKGVTIFPGIEVSCADNVQCIVVFDPSCGEDTFNKLLHRLSDVMPAQRSAAKANPVTLAKETIHQLIKAVRVDAHLKDVCIEVDKPDLAKGNGGVSAAVPAVTIDTVH